MPFKENPNNPFRDMLRPLSEEEIEKQRSQISSLRDEDDISDSDKNEQEN